MTENQFYFQTLVEGGSIILSSIGYFFYDSGFDRPNIAIAKSMSVDIFYFEGTNDLIHTYTIMLNSSIEKIAILKASGTRYAKDLLLIMSDQFDVFIVQFYGTNSASAFYFIKVFRLIDILTKQTRIYMPFYKKLASCISECSLSDSLRLICLSVYESNSVSNQLLFLAISMLDDIYVNIGFAKMYQNITGLVTQLTFMEPLDAEYKKEKMLPVLLMHYQYNNRFFTFEIYYCAFLKDFNGIYFVNEGIYLGDGPFNANNLSDHTIVSAIRQINYFSGYRPPNWIYFPVVSIAFDRILLFYNMKHIKHYCIGKFTDEKDNYMTLNAMSRPLQLRQLYYPKLFQQFVFVASFDDGSILHILIDFTQDEPRISSNTLEWPVFDNTRIRLPTCTDLRPIPWHNLKQHRMLLFLGSYSVDTAIFEVIGIQYAQLCRFRDKFYIVYGAIQDISVKTHGRLYCASSYGRDGSIMNVRFGYQLKSMSQLRIEEQPIICPLFVFLYKKQLYICNKGQQQMQLFQYYRDNENYCQLFQTAEFHELNQYRALNPILIASSDDQLVVVTYDTVHIGKQELKIVSDSAFFINAAKLVLLVCKGRVACFSLTNQQISYTLELTSPVVHIQDLAVDSHQYAAVCLEDNTLMLFVIEDGVLIEVVREYFPFQVSSFALHRSKMLSMAYVTSEYSVYSLEAVINGEDIKLDTQTIKKQLERTSNCYLMQQQGHIFVKSRTSLYYLETLQSRFHFLPILTQPLSNILNVTIVSPEVLETVGITCNRDSALPVCEERMTMMKYPTPSHFFYKKDKYLDFMLCIISDSMLVTTKDSPSYPIMWSDEARQTFHYLNITKMSTTTNFSIYRSLVKRSPVRVEQNSRYLSLLTEQYLGKMYLRFFDIYTHEELHKYLLDFSISSDMRFLGIYGRSFFVCTRYGVIDIHDHYRNQTEGRAKHLPYFDFYRVQQSGITFLGQLDLGDPTPCMSFYVKHDYLYAAVGDKLYLLHIQLNPFASGDFVVVAEGFYVQIQKTKQFPSYLIENIAILETGLAFTKSGILMLADRELDAVQEFYCYSDVKLLERFYNGLIAINYDNEVRVLGPDAKQLACYYSNANVTVVKQWENRVIMGTDTGAIKTLIRRETVFLQFLYNEILYYFEYQGQKLIDQYLENTVNGDIVCYFTHLPAGAQEAIAIRLNCSIKYIVDLLKEVDLDLIVAE